MSALIDTIRAIIRDELAAMRAPELAIVVAVYANDADGNNHQVDLRLRNSGVELQRVPVTVQRYGMSALPKVGDLVVVMFLGGELNAPVAVGCVYDEQNQPPEAAPGELVYQVPDEGGSRHIEIILPSGVVYTVDDTALTITAGQTEIKLKQDGDISIIAGGDLSISAGGNLSVTAGGELTLEAGSKVAVAGPELALQADAQGEIKAPSLKLGGMVQFSPS